MRRLFLLLILLLGTQARAWEDVSADSLWSWMAWPNAPVVVDVRELGEWQAGRISSALHYPWVSGELKARWRELSQASSIVVVCQSGSRAAAAATWLESQKDSGFSAKVYRLSGGMNAWGHSVAGVSSRRKAERANPRRLDWDLLGRLKRGGGFGSLLR